MSERICSVEGCEAPVEIARRGVCGRCYSRLWKRKELPPLEPLPSDRERIMSYVDRAGGLCACWPWMGARDKATQYGRAVYETRTLRAHRVVWMVLIGPIPDGLVLDHLCENPWCVNPFHMKVGTQRENVLRSRISITGINVRKTHCKWGDEFTPENTGIDKHGDRFCKACARRTKARYNARLKEDRRQRRAVR